MWINYILSYVFNACLFVYFRFNFEPVLVGAAASLKSGIITRFTGENGQIILNTSYEIILWTNYK